MRYQHPLLLLGFLTLGTVACRKDKEVLPPSVSILTPAAGSTVQVPDTLVVTVTASDDEHVERITVTLVDANGVPVASGSGTSPTTNPATVVLEIPVLSEQIVSGTYTLVATASDGASTSRDSRPITVIAAPFRLRAVFAVTEPSAGVVDIHKIDSVGNVSLAATIPGDLGGAAVSSRTQLLYVAGSITGPLQAIDPATFTPRWEKPNLGILGVPYFSALVRSTDERIYVCADDGRIRSYDEGSGSGTMVTGPTNGFRSERIITVGDIVVSAEREQATQLHRLQRYQRTSGTSEGDQALDKSPIALFRRTADNILLFGNRDGHGVVEDRYLPLGGGFEPFSWPTEITAVARVDNNTWIIALADGTVERFTYSNSSSIAIGSGPVINDLAFDNASGAIIAAANGQVLVFDPQSGTTVATYAIPGNVRYVLPLFNRDP